MLIIFWDVNLNVGGWYHHTIVPLSSPLNGMFDRNKMSTSRLGFRITQPLQEDKFQFGEILRPSYPTNSKEKTPENGPQKNDSSSEKLTFRFYDVNLISFEGVHY